jgi:hypothetical protein
MEAHAIMNAFRSVQELFDYLRPDIAGGRAASLREIDGAHLLSFRLREKTEKTPTTLLMLAGPAYVEAGWIVTAERRVVDLHPKWREKALVRLCASYPELDQDGYKRDWRALYRLWNDQLFQGRMPENEEIVPRDGFERQLYRRFQADHPSWYEYLVAAEKAGGPTGFAGKALRRVGNCGSVSARQAAQIVAWIARRAAKQASDIEEDDLADGIPDGIPDGTPDIPSDVDEPANAELNAKLARRRRQDSEWQAATAPNPDEAAKRKAEEEMHRKGQEALRLSDFREDYPEAHAWLVAHAGEPGSLAHDYLAQVRKTGKLSDDQLRHVQRLIAAEGKARERR